MDSHTFTPDTRTLGEYLRALRSGQPTPGGGSAAAYCGAVGASLGAMVCRLTIGRATDEVRSALTGLADGIDQIVDQLSQAARNDELLFARYQQATRLPKATDDEKRARSAARQEALLLAAEAPLTAAEFALRALRSLPEVARLGTHHALSDVEVSRVLLLASIDASLINVQVNVDMISDEHIAVDLASRMAELRAAASGAASNIHAELAARAD